MKTYEMQNKLNSEQRNGLNNLMQQPSAFFGKKYIEGKTIYQNYCKQHNKEYDPDAADGWAVAWCNTYRKLHNEEKEQRELMKRLERL